MSLSIGPFESSALVHGLEWCRSHLKSCHFQSALFLTDSQSVSLLSTAPAFLQPKFFWDIWDLSESASRLALSFQWVPGHAGLLENERADSLAKTGATLPVTHVPCPLAPTICGVLLLFVEKSFSQLPFLPDSFGFLGGTGSSPSYPLWTISTSLPRSQLTSVLLPMQDKTEEFFLQRLRTPSAGSDSPPPWLSRIQVFPACHLRHHFFHFWPLIQTLGRRLTIGWSSSTPPSLGRGRAAPPPPYLTVWRSADMRIRTLQW